MEPNNEQPWSYSYTFTQSWPKNDWAAYWPNDAEQTMLMLVYQDLLEHEVENSDNTDAITLLSEIGIKC